MSKIKKPLYLFLSLGLLASCQKKVSPVNDDQILYGLASPINLSATDTTFVFLRDYFIHPENVDSIIIPPGFKIYHNKKNNIVSILTESIQSVNPGILRFFVKGKSFDIPLKNKYIKNIKFIRKKSGQYDSFQLAGDFNGWSPQKTLLKKEGDSVTCELNLPPGNYGYQIVTNGTWAIDESNSLNISNGQGGYNSLLKVEELSSDQIPKIIARSFNDKSLTIEVSTVLKANVNAFFQNHVLKVLKTETMNASNQRITFEIPKESCDIERGFLRVFCNNRLTSGNDVLIPLQKGKIITDPKRLTRQDYPSNILYFMMVDRFLNGDRGNDYKMDTAIVKPKAQFMGGDLQGIVTKLKEGYFEKLGINAIWISPITQNPLGAWGQFKDPDTKFSSYHGYWPITLTTVDFRFGNETMLHELLSEAHKRNINVLLDYVAHHLHIEHPIIKNNPGWVTPLYLPDGTMNTEKWDEYRLTTWFDTFMPTLNLMDQKVTDYMVDSALHWVSNFEFDGFRHDATKHIPLNFWRTLTYKIKTRVAIPQNKTIYQVGETYGNNELISSYVNTGMLDAQFDFNLYDALLAVFTTETESFKKLSSALKQSFHFYGSHHLMANITGNQDKPRFISYADGHITSATPWQETKRIGWKNNIVVTDESAYNKMALAHAFNLTIPGIPVIYYGDEFGMPGANDPDNRRMMKFKGLSKKETWLKETTSKLSKIRRDNMALMYGDFEELLVTDDLFAYSRSYFGESVWVILNKGRAVYKFIYERPEGRDTVLIGNKPATNTKNFTLEIKPQSIAIIKWSL